MILHQMLRTSSQIRSKKQLLPLFSTIPQISSRQSKPPSFGIAFDIDGVILRGNTPIGGAPRALRRLYDGSGVLKVPFVFLTNGGGFRESKRAAELSELLDVKISPSQVLLGHSSFKQLVNRFENELIVAVGKGEPAAVMCEYGYKNVISVDEYALCFDNIDPLVPYKKWGTMDVAVNTTRKCSINSERVQAAFVVSDSVDWSRDIQVLCDILRTGGLPTSEEGPQPPLYFAHDDLKYQAGNPWFPILTRTGVFKGDRHSNHPDFPANMVVDTVEDAVDFIMRNENVID